MCGSPSTAAGPNGYGGTRQSPSGRTGLRAETTVVLAVWYGWYGETPERTVESGRGRVEASIKKGWLQAPYQPYQPGRLAAAPSSRQPLIREALPRGAPSLGPGHEPAPV